MEKDILTRNNIFDDLPHDEEEIVNTNVDEMIDQYLGYTDVDTESMKTRLITLYLAAEAYKKHADAEWELIQNYNG